MKNKILKFLPIIFIFIIALNTVYAALGEGLNSGTLSEVTQNNTTIVDKFETPLEKIFGTIFTILKVLAVAGIAINGVRYMYAGPSDRGQIKQSLIFIIIGTILVFGVEIFVKLISNTWNSAI